MGENTCGKCVFSKSARPYLPVTAIAAKMMRRAARAAQSLAVISRHLKTSPCSHEPWKLGKLNHIAIACPDLDRATALYRDVLHAKVSGKQSLPSHGVTVVFVELGDTKIELLHPLGDKSPIQNYLNKNASGGMHHICLEVNDIQSAMEELKKKNIRMLSDKPSIGAHGKPVVFLHPKDCGGVLVELEEVKN